MRWEEKKQRQEVDKIVRKKKKIIMIQIIDKFGNERKIGQKTKVRGRERNGKKEKRKEREMKRKRNERKRNVKKDQ